MMLTAVVALAAACLVPCSAEPPSSYLPPNSYNTMSQHSFAPPSSLSFDLSAPSAFAAYTGYNAPPKNYGPPKPVYSAPKPVYSAPKPVYSAPRPVYSAPKPIYSPPAPVYSAPKPTYLPPVSYAPPKPVYGPAVHEDYHSEPAHYDYQYTVQDSHYGTDFGHKEDRQGDVTHGQYMVLLPDGRRQIVDYVADKNGYRPTIRYEGAVKHGY